VGAAVSGVVSSTESSQALMARYFADLDDGDLARHLTDDVVWTNVETGRRIVGPAAVTEFVRALHARMADLRTRTYIVEGNAAMVEGDCLAAAGDRSGPHERVAFVVVYDLTPQGVAAMRLHMAVTRLPAGP
jgi:ketosteroid isomerase-like protein